MAKNSQRSASVETVQGGVHPYGVKEPLVVNGKWYLMDQLAMRTDMQPGGGTMGGGEVVRYECSKCTNT